MALLFIRSYAGMGQDLMGQVIQTGLEPALEDRTLLISGAAATLSTALNSSAKFVRVNTDSICSIKFGTTSAVAATTTNARMAANSSEFFALDRPGLFISVILNT